MRVWWSICIVFCLPLASAGTIDDPEVTDPADDHALQGSLPDPDGLFKSVDVVAAWITMLDADNLEIWIQASQEMRGGSVQGSPTTEYDYDLHFEVAGEAYMAGAHVVGNPPTVTPTGVASEAERGDDVSTVRMVVPLADIGAGPGSDLTGIYVASLVRADDQDMASDRAPDDGFGRDYAVPASGPELFFFDLEGDAANATIDGPTPEAIYIWNWTAKAGSYEIVVDAALSVDASISPMDEALRMFFTGPSGDILHECDCDGRRGAPVLVDVEAGSWRIAAIAAEGQAGFSWNIRPSPIDVEDEQPIAPINGTDERDEGNSTTSPDRDSPAVGFVGWVVLAAVWLARQR